MFGRALTIAGILALAASRLPADFSYQETTTITGGALAGLMKIAGVFSKQAREPVHTTVSIKGDRMVTRAATHATVIDLANQTVTSIDLQKKTYTVMTFEEFRQLMDQMSQKEKSGNQSNVTFKVSTKSTGNRKQVAGYDTKEMIFTAQMESTDPQSGQKGTMVITSDMWLAPEVAGYAEVRDFRRRLAQKLAFAPSGMFLSQPQVSRNMGELNKEMGKVEGMPVLQITSMGGEGQPGAAPSQSGAQPQSEPQSQPQTDRSSLGGKFGLGKKKQDQPSGQQAPAGSGAGSLLEMQTEQSGFSTSAVDDSVFAVPAGFKKVEPEKNRVR